MFLYGRGSYILSFEISVIIVNFKNLQDTVECVNSLLRKAQCNRKNYQILVVDNGSNDGSDIELKSIFPGVVILALQHNLGFAGANNVGIINALKNGADYVFLLNNDAIVDCDTIERLLQVFNQNPQIGIVGAAILDYYHPRIIESMGAKISFWSGYSKFMGSGTLYRENAQNMDVDYVSGAAMMIKREVIEKVGLLPEYYFLYGEEKDYCVRAKKKGYHIIISPKARVWHKTSSTVKKYLGLKNYYFHRNRLIFLRLHAKIYQFIFAIGHSATVIFPFYVIKYLIWRHSRPRDGLNEVFNFVLGVFDGIRFKTGYTKKIS